MAILIKNKIKYIRSLELKKNRKTDNVFIAEGPKLMDDLLKTFECNFIAATSEWLTTHPTTKALEIVEVSNEQLSSISQLKTPQQVLGIFKQPEFSFKDDVLTNQLCLGLDGIQDPGNLGTIIRLADWFGIEHIFCSHDTVDVFNPKVIQATMGAIARVKVHYTPLCELIKRSKPTAIYGTFLDGDNMYENKLSQTGILIMGNEGKGITTELEEYISHRLYIPNYPLERATSESLNVAVATAIACAEFRRQAACK